jgi:FtsH-binding integral membrane protein
MSAPVPTSPAATARWSGPVLTVLFLVIAALIFYAVFLLFPANSHFLGLIWIGILALVFAGGSYLAESASRDPTYQRSLAWGFAGLGFAVLYLSLGLAPTYGVVLGLWQYLGLILTTVAVAVMVGLIAWRQRSVAATQAREVPRAEWRSKPAPSALTYAAANSPSVPASAPSPPAPAGPTPPPGGH